METIKITTSKEQSIKNDIAILKANKKLVEKNLQDDKNRLAELDARQTALRSMLAEMSQECDQLRLNVTDREFKAETIDNKIQEKESELLDIKIENDAAEVEKMIEESVEETFEVKKRDLYVSAAKERNEDKFGVHGHSCVCCGKPTNEEFYVHMGENWMAHNTAETTPIYEDGMHVHDYIKGTTTGTQGAFPIGPSCAKKMKGFVFDAKTNKLIK
jgi:hypothetical protein